jgi:hypothetical protein
MFGIKTLQNVKDQSSTTTAMFGIKTLQNVKDQSGTTTAMFGINCYSGK